MTPTILTLMLSIFADVQILDLSKNKEPYRDPVRHYSVKLIPGWEPMKKDALDKVNQLVKERLQQQLSFQSIRYEGGFQLAGQPALSYPYILVQWQTLPSSNPSYEEIERGLGAVNKEQTMKQVEGAFSDAIKNLAVNEFVLDRAHNRVLSRLEGEGAGVGKLQGISAGFLGKEGIVSLHCYDKAASFPATLPNFQAMLDSFKYDEGFAFQPRDPGQPADPLANVLGALDQKGIITAIAVAIAVAVLVSIVRMFRDVRKPSRY
jgi:hypothetical protein